MAAAEGFQVLAASDKGFTAVGYIINKENFFSMKFVAEFQNNLGNSCLFQVMVAGDGEAGNRQAEKI